MRHELDSCSRDDLLGLQKQGSAGNSLAAGSASVPVSNFIPPMTTSLVDDLPSRTEMTAVEHGLRATVIQALRPCRDALEVGKDVFLAALSAADQRKPSIHPEEERILSPRACPTKRNEFALGRAAVRHALLELGEDYVPVLRGGYGEPLWPDGILGSITHCWPWAATSVCSSGAG